jgi:biopolymer transport protein ExbB/TolQ
MAALGWLSGGSLGLARLHAVGPSPWQLGIAVAGEIAVMALILIGGSAMWGWLPVRAVALVTAGRRTLVSARRRRADGKRDERDEDRADDDRDDDKDEAALAG